MNKRHGNIQHLNRHAPRLRSAAGGVRGGVVVTLVVFILMMSLGGNRSVRWRGASALCARRQGEVWPRSRGPQQVSGEEDEVFGLDHGSNAHLHLI